MVDASLGEIMTTCEKITWLLDEGEKWLKPEYRSAFGPLKVLELHLDHYNLSFFLLLLWYIDRLDGRCCTREQKSNSIP